METNKKLKAKDLINVGIYTAIYIVIFFVVGMLNAIPVLYPFLYVLIPLISGIPFMLFLTKIGNRRITIATSSTEIMFRTDGSTYIPCVSFATTARANSPP